jgi:hypothetical protein
MGPPGLAVVFGFGSDMDGEKRVSNRIRIGNQYPAERGGSRISASVQSPLSHTEEALGSQAAERHGSVTSSLT